MSDVQRSWDPVQYDSEKVSELANLALIVYGEADDETTNPDFLRWLYLDNPAGRAITWAAYDRTNGVMVGSYSVVPMQMVVDGEEVMGSVSVNLLTHPDYRRQGVFKALGEAMRDSCAASGILMSVSLAHAGSYPGFIRSLKFHDVGRRVLLVKALRLSNVTKQKVANAFLAKLVTGLGSPLRRIVFPLAASGRSDLQVEEVGTFDARFDELWMRARGVWPNMFVRSAAHLNWRYFGWKPRRYKVFAVSASGALRGYVVSRTMKMGPLRATVIVDALIDPAVAVDAIWRAVMPVIERRSEEEMADVISMYVLQHDPSAKVMRSIGYRTVPRKLLRGPNALCIGTYLPTSKAAATLRYGSWYFMSGDNDIP